MRRRALALLAGAACHGGDDAPRDSDVGDTDTVDTVTDSDPGLVDEPVALGGPVLDPEFHGDRVAWQHPTTSRVFLAEVDPATGQWVPEDGKGLTLGVASALLGDATRPATFNGPEWGDGGRSVFFTMPGEAGTSRVARVREGDGAVPFVTPDDGTHRSGVLPQPVAGPGGLAVFYFLGDFTDLSFAWRRVEGDDEDHPLPAAASADPTPRWIPGEDAVAVLATDGDGWTQAVRHPLDGGGDTPLTRDAGHKTDPFVLDDPGGGPRWLTVSVADTVPELGALVPGEVAVYREDGTGWTRASAFRVEDVEGGAPRAVVSLEPFVLDGEVWVSFVATEGRTRAGNAHVYVARADGSTLVRLTDGEAKRTDPEVVVLGGRPFVYYNVREGDVPVVRVVRDFLPGDR